MHWLALPLPWCDEPGAGPAPDAAGWWALRFTPRVALADGEALLLLELSTTERLWGGRAAQRAQVLQAWGGAAAAGGGEGAAAAVVAAHPPAVPGALGTTRPAAGGNTASAAAQRAQMGLPHEEAAPSAASGCAPLWGTGPTALVAQAMLRMRQAGLAPPARMRDLPLHTLAGLAPHLPTLERMGCRTWGALRALPRAGAARRLGAEVLLMLDQALGDAPEAHTWLELPEQFAWTAELPALAESAEALLWSAQRALHALQGWLQARHQGALALELSWRHDLRRLDGLALSPTDALRVRTAWPVQDMAHLRRLLAENLARTRLAAPANQVTLRLLESAPLAQRSDSLLPPGERESAIGTGPGGEARGEPLHQLLERLSARLGAARVQAPQLLADHRPEGMQRWLPASDVLAGAAPLPPGGGRAKALPAPPHAPAGALLPTWLVHPPRPLAVQGSRPCHQGPLRLLAGPHRFEAGWWSSAEAGDGTPVRRDYFMAHNPAAGLVWVFRERPAQASTGAPGATQATGARDATGAGSHRAPRWFLHGIFG